MKLFLLLSLLTISIIGFSQPTKIPIHTKGSQPTNSVPIPADTLDFKGQDTIPALIYYRVPVPEGINFIAWVEGYVVRRKFEGRKSKQVTLQPVYYSDKFSIMDPDAITDVKDRPNK
jgi:hypothetical protein